MKLMNIYQPKTLFLTITILTLGLFVTLNLMVVHLNREEGNSPRYQRVLVYEEKARNSQKVGDSSYSQGQRKPKAANLENNSPEDVALIQADVDNEKVALIQADVDIEKVLPVMDQYGQLSLKNGNKNQYHSYYEDEDEDEIENEDAIEDMETIEDEEEEEDDEEEEEDNKEQKITNKVFQPGDFGDIRGMEYFKRPGPLKYEVVGDDARLLESKKNKVDKNKVDTNKSGMTSALIRDGLYWSSYAESLIPKGLSYSNVTKLLRSLRSKTVQYLSAPTWRRCGRPKNGFVHMSDGTEMCARYRHPHMTLVFGEVLSFYLSRLLSMDNVPAVVLSRTNSTSPQWKSTNISSLQWEENQLVALIRWVPDIDAMTSEIKIPPLLLKAYQSGTPVTRATIQSSSLHSTEVSELVQWGTMFVFDYLTANYDRVASMQDAAEKENKPSIIQEPIRNLRKSSKTKKLWLIDNESGLLDAYELLHDRHSGARFYRFHKEMLRTMCIFQSSLVNAVTNLQRVASPHTRLENFAKSHEPLLKYMPHDQTYQLFVKLFSQRLKEVAEWISHCKVLNKK